MISLADLKLTAMGESQNANEILENVNVILTTPQGSVPLDRAFGVDVDVLDLPINDAKSLYVVEAITKVRKYEPRAVVEDVQFEGDAEEGKLKPRVVLRIESE